MVQHSFDPLFRPVSYFENLTLEEKLGSNIKGEIRGKLVSSHIKNEFVPPQLLQSEISESLKIAQGRLHPWMMGGEYLPTLQENEVEICRIVLKSTTMDVFSLRAQQTQGFLSYRVVDEYGDNNYVLPIPKSENTLTLGELINNLDNCKEISIDSGFENDYGGGGLVKPWVFQQFEFGDDENSATDFVNVYSVFYSQIEEIYNEKKIKWFRSFS